MSANPGVEGIVTLPVLEERIEPVPQAPVAAAEPARARDSSRAWIAPAAIAVIGIVASGALGYLLYTTTQQRDGLHSKLVASQAQLTAAQQDAATKKVTADYVAMYVADQGKVETDYQTVVLCNDFNTCRTAAQQLLADLQKFQADRKAANVPSNLLSTDSSVGDALSAAIAGQQEFIVGIDNNDETKAKEGGAKADAAMLSLDKATASLGTQLK